MQLLLVRHLWGIEGSPDELWPRFKQKGYGAIEAPLPPQEQQATFRETLARYELAYIPQIFTVGQNVKEHVDSFRSQVEQAQQWQPLKINSHSGQDTWTYDESARFFEQALAIEAELGATVAHETHRGKIFFAPTITHQLITRFETLKLCCDLSHWVCVCERLLDDQLETIRLCGERCIHIHARVGFEEGPQVPDPRASEYRRHQEAHENWWSIIWEAQEQRGMETTTLTPEFGPPPYLWTLPYTQAPVVDLEAVCDWQAQRQAARFARRGAYAHQ